MNNLRGLEPPSTLRTGLLTALGLMLLMLATSVAPIFAAAHEPSPLESQVKAAMLYKFLGYVDWPPEAFASPELPYRIYVLGSTDIEQELRTITESRTVNERPIKVLRVRNPRRIRNPHMVFVSRHSEEYLPQLVEMAEQQNFLIVTESDDGLAPGGVINLRLVDGRVGFDVSLPEAHKSQIKLSARLLAVASSVQQATP